MDKQTGLLSKTLVIGILILLIGMSVVSSTGNISKSSFICKSNNHPYEPNYSPVPKITCASSGLEFEKVPPGQIVYAQIKVCNCGDELSFLNWHVDTTNVPAWGTWEFFPENGTNLLEPYCAIIDVKCTITEEIDEYISQIYLYNTDNSSDYCMVVVHVYVPRNKSTTYSLFQWFYDRFPFLEVFLRIMNLLR